MVYLRATPPPSEEDEFFKLTNTRKDEVVIMRAWTTKGTVLIVCRR